MGAARGLDGTLASMAAPALVLVGDVVALSAAPPLDTARAAA
jgi:hypothetical protein